MPEFTKYMHIERLQNQEVEDILDGNVYIFYKIDGTNGSVWWDNDKGIQAGSRNRVLSLDNDNAGFCAFVYGDSPLLPFYFNEENRHLILYGEWLVPHSLKTYRDDAWREFYVFDVWDTENECFLSYDEYKVLMDKYDINYIPPLAIFRNPTEENLLECLEKSGQFLIMDGGGIGEGITIKNYDFVNKYGRTVWAKMITNEFKEKHHKEMGAPEINGTLLVEQDIIEEFLTGEFIRKEQAKIINTHGGWSNQNIPELLGRVWYEFIREETTNFLKKHKNPKINFRLLNTLCLKKTKQEIGL